MRLLSRLKFAAKLRFMTGAAVIGLGVFALLAFVTLNAVRINSPMYQNIALGYQLAGDCYDPPASLVAALPVAIEAEDATTPEATSKAVEQLRAAHKAFTDSQKHYLDALPDGAIRTLMQTSSGPEGEAWFSIAEKEYIPLLLSGDHAAARAIRINQMNPIFRQHKAANDRLSDLTADWIPTAEKTAAGIIRVRSFEMTAIFILMAAALLFIGASISRSILNPLRRMVDFLGAMATGDLSNHFEVDSTDEMSEVAQALNSTTHTFREVLTSIQEASERTASASAELTATAKDTSERSRVHAAETQQVSAALFEMSAAIAEVSKSAQYAASSGVATETAADQGSHVVDETMSVIRRAAEITSEAAEQIQSLGKSSEQIGRIVGVIEEIASQTNLLALNAAIEAARAGEQGRGFAVVAGEVRRLAERTTTATKEISEMISSIQQETSGAVKSMANGRQQVDTGLKKVEECSHALTEIVKLVRTEGGMVDQIASASVEQTSTANQVTESMHSIARFTEYATAAGEQTADACGELTKLASTLEQQVQRFKFGTGRMGTAA